MKKITSSEKRGILLSERNRLLDRYLEAKGIERLRIVGRLVVIDDELEAIRYAEQRKRNVAN